MSKKRPKFIRGAGSKGEDTPLTFFEEPNTLRSKSTAKIVDAVSEGEILGFVGGPAAFHLDDISIQDPGPPLVNNFPGIFARGREGTPTQDHFPGSGSVATVVGVGIQVTVAGGPVVKAILDPNADAIRVTVRIPKLAQFLVSGNTLVGATVSFRIEVRPFAGIYTTAFEGAISGKTTTNYERSYRIELPAGGNPWDVRVTRLTPDSLLPSLSNDLFWSSYTTLTDVKLSYPDTALAQLTVDAEQFGTRIPTRSYLIDGLKIQIPSNYDPFARTYSPPIWDGTFQTQWSNNPAWVLYDLLTNKRYGLGDQIDPDQIDKFSLFAIGQYCDELVDDGQGGTEPRFTFNGPIADQRDAFQVISAITSTFQGMTYWGSGAVTAVQDSPADPVKLVTPANVIDGEFTYAGSSLRSRHTVIYVTWNDPALGYRPTIEVVEDTEAIKQFGVRQKNVVAFGCTSRGQAKRYGRWILDTERNSTEAVSYRASLDHADVRPGDIIAIADPAVAGARFGGRVVSFPTPGVTVEVDASVTLELGETYTMSFVRADGAIQTVALTDVAGTYTVLSMDQDPGDVLPGAVWVITASNAEPRQFRVISVGESDKNEYEIQAILHDPLKYGRIEQNLRLEPSPFSVLPTGPIPAPTDLQVTEHLIDIGGTVLSRATFSWRAVDDGRVQFYEAQIKPPGSASFDQSRLLSTVSMDLGDVVPGDYTLRVRARTALGQVSPFAEIVVNPVALREPPPDVLGCSVQVNNKGIAVISWIQVDAFDMSHYEIRHHPKSLAGGASWETSTPVTTAPKTASSAVWVTLFGTYFIKAIDTGGRESVNACEAESPLTNPTPVVVVFDSPQDPTFPGDKTDVVRIGDKLRLDAPTNVMASWSTLASVSTLAKNGEPFATLGTYLFDDNTIDFGAVYEVRIEPKLNYLSENPVFVMADWLTLAGVKTLSGVAEGETADAVVEVRVTLDDPGGSPTWGPWTPLIGPADFFARGVQRRAILTSSDGISTPLVCELGACLGLEQRTEGADNLTAPDTGLSVVFDFPFFQTPAISVQGQGLTAGDTAIVTNQSRTGFDVVFEDSTATPIDNQIFDYVAVGPGREIT